MIGKPYLLIKVGYEGIDKIVWLSDNLNEIKEIRKRAIKVDIAETKRRHEKINKRMGWIDPDLDERDEEIAERYCIQQWDGKGFECICYDIGIKFDKVVFY